MPVRVDIDRHQSGPPSLDFEVDCSALPYAEDEERDFCYKWGRWAVLRHERGIIVACSCGEFGGFVLWYDKGGTLLQTLLAGDIPQTLIADQDALLCVTGITHLSISEGAIQAFRLFDDRWQAVSATPLAKQAETIEIEEDGSLLIRLVFDAGALRYRAGIVEQLPSRTPPNSTQQPTERAITQPRDQATPRAARG